MNVKYEQTHNIITKLLARKRRSKNKKWENYSATFNNINRQNFQKTLFKTNKRLYDHRTDLLQKNTRR